MHVLIYLAQSKHGITELCHPAAVTANHYSPKKLLYPGFTRHKVVGADIDTALMHISSASFSVSSFSEPGSLEGQTSCSDGVKVLV